jgi:hypothetical protein
MTDFDAPIGQLPTDVDVTLSIPLELGDIVQGLAEDGIAEGAATTRDVLRNVVQFFQHRAGMGWTFRVELEGRTYLVDSEDWSVTEGESPS